MMLNLYRRLLELLPREPLLVGTVTAHNADGTSTVTLPGGGILSVRGQDVAVGQKAFVRAGISEGPAPDLYEVEIEV